MCWSWEVSLVTLIIGTVFALISAKYFKDYVSLPMFWSLLQMQLSEFIIWRQEGECNLMNQFGMYIGAVALCIQPTCLLFTFRYTGPKRNRTRLLVPFWYSIIWLVMQLGSITMAMFFSDKYPYLKSSTQMFGGEKLCGTPGPLGHLIWSIPQPQCGSLYPSHHFYYLLLFSGIFALPHLRGIIYTLILTISIAFTFKAANFTNESGSFWCYVVVAATSAKIIFIIIDVIYQKVKKKRCEFIWTYLVFSDPNFDVKKNQEKIKKKEKKRVKKVN
ncbi:hypothetical protein M0812_14199 [Anaeramoeba flamelloides]|uniref:Uncharacterized protein n=1 Tax=Anaeramoeba flamelloides TaxID=1746091 RepID=A0AAV7ZI07_9EUKA|nr:hypothetical protein M0812_14199 [Anaeramoeba flamelloides]